MTHLVTVTVGVNGPDDWSTVHDKLAEVARDFSGDHHVSVGSCLADAEDDEGPLPGEYADENTLYRVRCALRGSGLSNDQAEKALHEMQNAGILFRQRR